MATIDCVVDTKPMADAVGTVSTRVNATTTAVIAMQEAVIKSEKEASDAICRNVDKGFFALIRSQMSMKLAKSYTDMNVKLMLLREQAKSLASLQQRMEADVSRLRREYYKIFHDLDKSLENRVGQLDKSAMGLAETQKSLIADRLLKDAPETMFAGKDSEHTSQMALMARVKNKTSRALMTIGGHIQEGKEYETALSDHMERQSVEEEKTEYIPVVITREESVAMSGAEILQCYLPNFLSGNARDQVQSAVMQNIEGMLEREQSAQEKEQVRREFQRLLAEAGLDQRISSQMQKLFENGGC